MEKLKVTLKRSPIGCTQSQISTVKGLGLRRVGSVRELEWSLPRREHRYIRVELHRSDGKKAWSNPIFL